MFALEVPPAAYDVVWAEGSIYIIGFERGLREWSTFLKDGGYVAASELTWLDRDAPEELRRFWDEAYPAMQDVAGNLATLKSCGFEEVGHFVLPESAFWDDYYTPIEKRLDLLARSTRVIVRPSKCSTARGTRSSSFANTRATTPTSSTSAGSSEQPREMRVPEPGGRLTLAQGVNPG